MNPLIRLCALTLLLLSSGCFTASLGGGTDIHRGVTPPTLGKEFITLKRAHDQGALEDEEYERAAQLRDQIAQLQVEDAPDA